MQQYKNIFELNIKRVQQIEAENKKMGESSLSVDEESILSWCEQHFKKTHDEVGRWNGRQIKNAFQIGASLAHYDSAERSLNEDVYKRRTSNDYHENGYKPYTLNDYQFSLVAETTKEFDRYMAITKKGKDSELAKREGVRDDIGAANYRYNYSGESPYGLGGYAGQGQPPRYPTESPRYVASQQDYREQGRGYYEQDPRRIPDSYGQHRSPQGGRMDPNNPYPSQRPNERGGSDYERESRRERIGDNGPPDADEENYGSRSQWSQNQYSGPLPVDRFDRF